MPTPLTLPSPNWRELDLVVRGALERARPARPAPARVIAAIGLAGVTLSTATIIALALESDGIGIADASPVYLLAVVAVGSAFGTLAALATALISFLVYDALFTQPQFSLVVRDAREWLDLLLFLFVALVIGRLVSLQRGRAEEADRRAREAASLFAISRLLATAPSTEDAAPEIARRLAHDVGLRRVWVAVGEAPDVHLVADTVPGEAIPSSPTVVNLVRTAGDDPARWIRTHGPGRRGETSPGLDRLRVGFDLADEGTGGVRAIGHIGAIRERARGLPDRSQTRLLALAADQIAMALRRDRLAQAATDAEVARQGDALKTALIDSVSHDLRTPLASIRATAGGLADEAVPWTGTAIRAAARRIDDEVARLDRLVRGVLDLSRIEARAIRADLEPHDLQALLEPVVARARPGDGTVRPPISIDLPPDLPAVLVDPVLFDVVLGNLLENADVHAGPAAGIAVSARAAGADRLEVVVEDAGPGVPSATLPHLFERFYRVAAGAQGPRRGLGIGLSVVRGLMEAMGGTATARPSRLGGLAVVVTVQAIRPPSDGGA